MMKAKFLGSCKGEKGICLFYSYRGYEYMVTDYGWSGYSESLKEQHKQEQSRIDRIIEEKERNKGNAKEEFDFDKIWDVLGWD